jgi:hypothetical protein
MAGYPCHLLLAQGQQQLLQLHEGLKQVRLAWVSTGFGTEALQALLRHFEVACIT